MLNFSELQQILNNQRRVLVVSHLLPDGDCLGSAVALSLGLKQSGHIVQNSNGDSIPEMYEFLSEIGGFLLPSCIEKTPEIAFLVDCSDFGRIGPKLQLILNDCPCIINIDHHLTNKYFGHYNYVDPMAAATGELIFKMLQQLNWPISVEMATALYTAIVTDTGSFQFENTTAETLKLAATLRELGAQADVIRKWLWESRPLAGLLLLKEALNSMHLEADGRLAWMALEQKAFARVGATNDLAEGVINYPRTLKGVEISILFREVSEEEIKVGLRSKNYVDVSLLAAQFGGGGHKRAAGCTVHGTLTDVIVKVLTYAKETLGKHTPLED
ncbi:MAG: bifunctional oligoribonuclease/PAP phosphatase NrnA [Syntrophomonadaceae bacterium]|nr:bifunctional oligoribonuclease/PAP phosphatase NrnA [Syntrophomonadaceae bacterium]